MEDNGAEGGLCLDKKSVHMMCIAGTPLEDKMKSVDMAACAPMTSETPVAEEARAKKIKCPSDCPTFEENKAFLLTNKSMEVCFLQELGWMDSEGLMVNEVRDADVSSLPVADSLTQKKIKTCVKEISASPEMKAKRKKCGKCYSNKERKTMDQMFLELNCFMKLFDESCAEYVNNAIFDSFGINPDTSSWVETGIVPDHLSEVPDQDLTVTWSKSGVVARINSTIASDDMFERPVLSFDAEADALYTVMIVDNGIEALGGMQWFHWLKSNVPGSDLSGGDENYEYIAPFYFERNATNTGVVDTGDAPGHDILVLVYKQDGTISIEENQSGCNPSIEGRVTDKDGLAEKYGLEGPVAGTFFWTKYYEGGDYYMCYFTKCTGDEWPFPVPGVTDQPQCQAA